MKIKQLTFPCVVIFITLAVFPLVSQEQPGADNGDQSASSGAVQPNEADSASSTTKDVIPSSQTTDRGTANTEESKPSASTAAHRPAAVKTAATAEKATKKDLPVKEAVSSQAGAGLLDVSDEEYKYIRIPGMPAVKKTDNSLTSAADDKAADESAEPGVSAEKEKDGLFGMSKETGDTVTRVALVLLIAIIFILYRVRSRSGGRRVTRSYLKR